MGKAVPKSGNGALYYNCVTEEGYSLRSCNRAATMSL